MKQHDSLHTGQWEEGREKFVTSRKPWKLRNSNAEVRKVFEVKVAECCESGYKDGDVWEKVQGLCVSHGR